jgi:hypothetical protein
MAAVGMAQGVLEISVAPPRLTRLISTASRMGRGSRRRAGALSIALLDGDPQHPWYSRYL